MPTVWFMESTKTLEAKIQKKLAATSFYTLNPFLSNLVTVLLTLEYGYGGYVLVARYDNFVNNGGGRCEAKQFWFIDFQVMMLVIFNAFWNDE